MKFHIEDISHFGAWCITSSPRILGYDLSKDDITDTVRDIIKNERAITVNQDWSGSPAHFVRDFSVNKNNADSSVAALECTSSDPHTRVGMGIR